MKTLPLAAAALIGTWTCVLAQGGPQDPITHLPLPGGAGTVRLYDGPMTMNDVPVCKSKAQMNYYTGKSGKVDAAIAWYSANLQGFKHFQGYGSGRSQDAFYNAAGTLMVSITGSPAPKGQNTDVYAVVYAAVQPGISEKVIAGMSMQQLDCR